jgi:hypothetical protein
MTLRGAAITAVVAVPLALGWLVGICRLSYRAGYASSAATLKTWSGSGAP